ncbi:hypothetical protein BT96DRAFT_971215 [Gymnopus androsaceus JB14]|uniref:Uncharacterized protein n=1 Tax=Gymnopus androsaceus JB14 TaxID=1447944 RepID=A0A6A4IA26_9AGAR|nr:hypothetical protein BT96DRAFT_971215 [Gymnopus androsaceus JB14]
MSNSLAFYQHLNYCKSRTGCMFLCCKQLGVPGALTHVVNTLIMLSGFSAGNGYVYSDRFVVRKERGSTMSRLGWCTKKRCSSLLSHSASKFLEWFIELVVVSSSFNYACISLSYLRFYKPCAYYAFFSSSLMIGIQIPDILTFTMVVLLSLEYLITKVRDLNVVNFLKMNDDWWMSMRKSYGKFEV